MTSWLLDLVKFNNATDILKYVQGKLGDKMAAWQAHCVGTVTADLGIGCKGSGKKHDLTGVRPRQTPARRP